mgnify:CR=1 FL=1
MCSIEEAWAGQDFENKPVVSQADTHNAYMSLPDNVFHRGNDFNLNEPNKPKSRELTRGINSKYSREPRVPKMIKNTNDVTMNISSQMPPLNNYGGLEPLPSFMTIYDNYAIPLTAYIAYNMLSLEDSDPKNLFMFLAWTLIIYTFTKQTLTGQPLMQYGDKHPLYGGGIEELFSKYDSLIKAINKLLSSIEKIGDIISNYSQQKGSIKRKRKGKKEKKGKKDKKEKKDKEKDKRSRRRARSRNRHSPGKKPSPRRRRIPSPRRRRSRSRPRPRRRSRSRD